jgi:hemolysin activation/secretion protein
MPRLSVIACSLPFVLTGVAWAEDSPKTDAENQQRVDVEEYVVEGNTVLGEDDIDEAVYSHLGPDIPKSEIEAARAALEKKYQSKGYQTVQVQVAGEDDAGAVHLAVVELRVGRLKVAGSRYYLLSEIKQEAPSVQEGKVPNFNQLHDDLVTLNQIPGRQVTPELKAGQAPGTVDVSLVVKDEFPAQVSVDVNNQHGLDTTPLRTAISGSYDNLWQLGHKLSLVFQTAPERPDDTTVGSASYLARFLGTPYSLLLNGTVSNSNVAAVAGTDLVGNGETVGLHGTANLPGNDEFTHSVQAGVDYKAFRNDTRYFGTSTTGQIVPVSYFPVSASYNAVLNEDDGAAVTTGTFTVSAAPPRSGSNRLELDANRRGLRGQEFWFRASLERSQDIYVGFRGQVRLDGQLSDQPLVSNEQFPLGGLSSIRGYYEAEKLADTGFSGSLQLISPSLPQLVDDWIFGGKTDSNLRLHGFVDGGRGYLHLPLPGQESQFTLLSTGGGAEGSFSDFLSGGFDVAIPLLATDNTKAYSPQILFHVSAVY